MPRVGDTLLSRSMCIQNSINIAGCQSGVEWVNVRLRRLIAGNSKSAQLDEWKRTDLGKSPVLETVDNTTRKDEGSLVRGLFKKYAD